MSADPPISTPTLVVKKEAVLRLPEFMRSVPPGENPSSHLPTMEALQIHGACQTANMYIVLSYAVLRDENQEPRWFWLSMGGSTVAASGAVDGRLLAESECVCGWYLAETVVKVSVNAGFRKVFVTPATTQCSGSVTSSVSLNVGTFGSEVTSGASWSNSFSRSINDIFINDDSFEQVVQSYVLSQSLGGAYRDPSDLGHFTLGGKRLYGVPSAAKANLPLMTQSVWLAPDGFVGEAKLVLSVEMSLVFAQVEPISVGALSAVGGVVANAAPVASTLYRLSGEWSWSLSFPDGTLT